MLELCCAILCYLRANCATLCYPSRPLCYAVLCYPKKAKNLFRIILNKDPPVKATAVSLLGPPFQDHGVAQYPHICDILFIFV